MSRPRGSVTSHAWPASSRILTRNCLNSPGTFAAAVETNENWTEANRYINMDDLREHKKLALRQAA